MAIDMARVYLDTMRKSSVAYPLCAKSRIDRTGPKDIKMDVCKLTRPPVIGADKSSCAAYVMPNDEVWNPQAKSAP